MPTEADRPGTPPGERNLEADLFIRQKLYAGGGSSLDRYRQLVLGDAGLFSLIRYELLTLLFGSVPGALGLVLRKLFYPAMFRKAGRGVVFGRNTVFRHPGKIELGDRVIVDDNALIDGRGSGDEGVSIGSDTIVNRGVSIQAKSGPVRIGAKTNVGAGTVIVSMGGIEIGEEVGIGGGSYISGGGFRVELDEDDARGQRKFTKGPIRIGDKAWLGMRAMVLDGVQVGEGCIIGAASVVVKDLPPHSVAAGSPAKIRRERMATAGTPHDA